MRGLPSPASAPRRGRGLSLPEGLTVFILPITFPLHLLAKLANRRFLPGDRDLSGKEGAVAIWRQRIPDDISSVQAMPGEGRGRAGEVLFASLYTHLCDV